MPPEPLVWIVLVNWNGRSVTLDCLSSLRATGYHHCQILVVDNASSDGSPETIQKLFPSVELLVLPENRRFAGGNNAGIFRALQQGAEMVLLLNNDTTVEAGFLAPMVERLQSDRSIGIVAPKILYHDDPRRFWFAGGRISFWTGTMRHLGIREVDNGQFDTSREIDYASGCCLLARKELIETIGGLDESYYMYSEDADWSVRARKAGYKIAYEPRSRIYHRLSVSAGGHLSWYKMRHKFTSNFRFFLRHGRWYHCLVFPWLSVCANAVAALRYLFSRGR
jgi:GT2 family glycosyltransferase